MLSNSKVSLNLLFKASDILKRPNKIAFVLREKLQWLDSLNQWVTFSVKCFKKGMKCMKVWLSLLHHNINMSYHAYLKSEKFFPGNNYSVYEGELELSQFSLFTALSDWLEDCFPTVKGISMFHLLTPVCSSAWILSTSKQYNSFDYLLVRFNLNAGSARFFFFLQPGELWRAPSLTLRPLMIRQPKFHRIFSSFLTSSYNLIDNDVMWRHYDVK